MHKDFLELLRLLSTHKVRFLLIGGYAYSLHVEPRYTKDLDLWIDPTPSNAKKALIALEAFGAPVDNLTVKDLSTPGLLYIFGIPPLRVDILTRVADMNFTKIYSRKVTFKSGRIAIPVVGRKDLIAMKKAASRPQDLADLLKLQLVEKHTARHKKRKSR